MIPPRGRSRSLRCHKRQECNDCRPQRCTAGSGQAVFLLEHHADPSIAVGSDHLHSPLQLFSLRKLLDVPDFGVPSPVPQLFIRSRAQIVPAAMLNPSAIRTGEWWGPDPNLRRCGYDSQSSCRTASSASLLRRERGQILRSAGRYFLASV